MKKILLYIPIIMLTFWSCNQMDDVYKDLDQNVVKPYSENIEYTLQATDYTNAAGLAKAVAKTNSDSTWAGYISSFQCFNDNYPSSVYIPKLLPNLFPALKKGSVAIITYNYFAEMPDDLTKYSGATSFEFNEGLYKSADSLVAFAGYFFPDFNPDIYIPQILTDSFTTAEDGNIYAINYLYSDATPAFPSSATKYWLNEDFETSLGQFDTTSVVGAQGWIYNYYSADSYAKMSGYSGGAKTNEDWLISDPVVLGSESSITLNFNHTINFLNHHWEQLAVLISKDYDGSDIESATWDTISWGEIADTALLGSSWDKVASGDIDLASYAGETINLAFKYTSSTSNAPTWEIYDVSISSGAKIVGKTPYNVTDYYKLNGSTWEKQEDVYCLTSEDYKAMGDPGTNNNFSTTVKPENYLPKFLNAKYPSAGEGVSKIVVYNYYINYALGNVVVADKLTYTSGEWVSSYNYIGTTTDQFIHNGTEWIFDPTVKFTMITNDYDIIVKSVLAENPSYGYTDGSREFYYGAASKYANFDLRVSKKAEYSIPGFDGLTEEQAIDKTWSMIPEAINLLLTSKYPDAVSTVSGVDVHYIVTFYTYENDLSSFYYSIDFQCTKSGPNPEFTQNMDYGDPKDGVYGKYGMKKVE